jgi:hypothetical protein
MIAVYPGSEDIGVWLMQCGLCLGNPRCVSRDDGDDPFPTPRISGSPVTHSQASFSVE